MYVASKCALPNLCVDFIRFKVNNTKKSINIFIFNSILRDVPNVAFREYLDACRWSPLIALKRLKLVKFWSDDLALIRDLLLLAFSYMGFLFHTLQFSETQLGVCVDVRLPKMRKMEVNKIDEFGWSLLAVFYLFIFYDWANILCSMEAKKSRYLIRFILSDCLCKCICVRV